MTRGAHRSHIDTMNATPHIYIESDIPEGMTLTEWRRSSGPQRRQSFWRRLLALGGPQFA
jgi:hypothetical protein